jgi:poly(ribitol-phosphate) beta-N-acetylglucosaminyltransferase
VKYADKNDSDVLIGKMVGHRRSVPHALFRVNAPNATLWTKPLMSSLTPHKLFRRSFLNQHSLRFPEGKRRLEDHVFVVQAYFLASKIAVLSNYPCYHHISREDASNAGLQQVDPAYYFGFVREVIDIIEAHTEPGEQRDHVLERPFSHEMMGRVTRRSAFAAMPADYRNQVFDVVRTLMLERFPANFGDRFALAGRVRAAAVRDDRMDILVEMNERAQRVQARAVLRSLTWQTDHWHAEIEAEAVFSDGTPIRFTPIGDDTWSVDPRLLPPQVHADTRVSTVELLRGRPSVTVVERSNEEEWFVRGTFTAALVPMPGDSGPDRRVVHTGTADFAAATLAGGRLLPDGLWDVFVRLASVGVDVKARLGVDEQTQRPLPSAAIVGPRPSTAIPYLTDKSEKLTLDVGQRKETLLGTMLSRRVGPVVIDGDNVTARVDVDVTPDAAQRTFKLLLLGDKTTVGQSASAFVTTADGGAMIRCSALPRPAVAGTDHVYGPARYTAAARSRAKDEPLLFGIVDVDRHGRIVSADFDPSHRRDIAPMPPHYGRRPLAVRVKGRIRRGMRRLSPGHRG